MMAETETVIDVSEVPELRRIAERVRESRTPVILRTEDGEVAKVVPLRPRPRRSVRPKTQEDFEEFRAAFGSWQDVDIDELKLRAKRARGSRRPSLEL
jgi:hypothetical protein